MVQNKTSLGSESPRGTWIYNLGFGERPKKSRGTSEEFPDSSSEVHTGLNLIILGKHFFIRIEVSIFAK
jgi:hypothetical protein